MADEFDIKRGNVDDLDMVEPLWENLRDLLHGLSPYFKERLLEMTWEGRKQALRDKSDDILFEYAVDARGRVVGYCISTTARNDDKTGEIDSIYVDEEYRKSGIGKQLVENAVSWMDSRGVETQKLLVGVGNEQVLNFYGKFGFYPVHVVLQKKNK